MGKQMRQAQGNSTDSTSLSHGSEASKQKTLEKGSRAGPAPLTGASATGAAGDSTLSPAEAQLIEEYRRLRKAERRKERRVRKLLGEGKLFTLAHGPLRRGSIATAQAQYEREQAVVADYLRTGNLARKKSP